MTITDIKVTDLGLRKVAGRIGPSSKASDFRAISLTRRRGNS